MHVSTLGHNWGYIFYLHSIAEVYIHIYLYIYIYYIYLYILTCPVMSCKPVCQLPLITVFLRCMMPYYLVLYNLLTYLLVHYEPETTPCHANPLSSNRYYSTSGDSEKTGPRCTDVLPE